ncbi:hypothetical protein GCM10010345_74330 [Streptomyces canarius]|uniref:Uncharacterized protein n=1 Tax=Streptomyces canarius TaxID=285453 RepID=A0ABQ3D7B5_9ACTN|nr:hypothetical protein GCM10010345_74330 [Streptomyces canarius]
MVPDAPVLVRKRYTAASPSGRARGTRDHSTWRREPSAWVRVPHRLEGAALFRDRAPGCPAGLPSVPRRSDGRA